MSDTNSWKGKEIGKIIHIQSDYGRELLRTQTSLLFALMKGLFNSFMLPSSLNKVEFLKGRTKPCKKWID